VFQFESSKWHSKYTHLYNNTITEKLRIAHFILIVCFYFYLVYNHQEKIDQNKSDWYFNAISLTCFVFELDINIRLCYFLLLSLLWFYWKKKKTQAHSKLWHFLKTITYLYYLNCNSIMFLLIKLPSIAYCKNNFLKQNFQNHQSMIFFFFFFVRNFLNFDLEFRFSISISTFSTLIFQCLQRSDVYK
jgi:hypothetical protein